MITKTLFTGISFWVLLGAASGFARAGGTVDPFSQVSQVSVAPNPNQQLATQTQAEVFKTLLSMLANQQQSITDPNWGLYGNRQVQQPPVQTVQQTPTIVNVYNNIGDTSVNGVANSKVNKTLEGAVKNARNFTRGEHSAVPSENTSKENDHKVQPSEPFTSMYNPKYNPNLTKPAENNSEDKKVESENRLKLTKVKEEVKQSTADNRLKINTSEVINKADDAS